MNRYERHLSLKPVLAPNKVYTGADMNEVAAVLQAAGFRWVAGSSPIRIESAIRVDNDGGMRHAPIEYYEKIMPELEVITL